MQAFFPGFALGFSLIMAIGAQNAFVLRQGLRRSHVLAVCLICASSDALLITAGVAGFGWIVSSNPWISSAVTWGGAAFLFVYGAFAFRAALGPPEHLEAALRGTDRLVKALATCLALTWLNPHVYLDTVVLLGSIANGYGEARYWFGLGAVVASFSFFLSLGYGARLLSPIFARPMAWRVLDAIVGVTMWVIALSLVLH